MGQNLERRKYPRQEIDQSPVKATLVLTGGSLLNKDSHSSVEIETQPINLSRGGMSLVLAMDAVWATISPDREIKLSLQLGDRPANLVRAKVVRLEKRMHRLCLEFLSPLPDEALSQILH